MGIDWNPIISNVLGIVLSAAATALVALLVQWARKKGLEISADQQARLEYFAKQGALKAEELATAALKRPTSVEAPSTPAEKLQVAVTHVTDALPGVTPEQARDAVQSVLPLMPGIGAVTLGVPGELVAVGK